MIDEYVKMVKTQYNMNEIFNGIESNKLIDSSKILGYFKNNELFDNDIIDLLVAEYYIKNVNSTKENNLINFIECFGKNKELLHNYFMTNDGLALEFIIDYLNSYLNFDNRNLFISELSDKEKDFAKSLSPIVDYMGFNYLPSLARGSLFKIGCEYVSSLNNVMLSTDKLEIKDFNILSHILVSDAYTYMNLYNEDEIYSDLINLIEEEAHNFDYLFSVMQNTKNCIYNFLYFQAMLFIECDIYSDIYEQAKEKNPNFIETIKQINPYYIVDMIESNELKKYRK